MRIVLLGFMGSGKSTIGKLLAHRMGLRFTDLDEFIEKESGKKIDEIFTVEGEDSFRKLERNYFRRLMRRNNQVIATGGGTPCFFNTMEIIRQKSVSVYLKASTAALHKRLGIDKKSRPLLKNINPEEMPKFIREKLLLREKFYLCSDITISCGIKTPVTLAKMIEEKIRSAKKN